MKVLFIHPNIRTGGGPHFVPGIASLSAVLKRAGHRTELLFLQDEPTRDDLVARVKAERPDLIGFSSLTLQWPLVVRFTQWLREEVEVPILHGGCHVTMTPDTALATPGVDLICVGEGEEALLELVQRLERGEPYPDIPNLWLRLPDGRVRKNPLRPLLQDLDTLPFMDRDICRSRDLVKADVWEGSMVMAGRGCPFRCTYCINNALHRLYQGLGRYPRMRSPEKVVEECVRLRDEYGMRRLKLYDDTFTYDQRWLKAFCDLYAERVALPFLVNVRADTVRSEQLAWLKRAGCSLIILGVESGSERLRREILGRRMTDRQLLDACRAADDLGIRTWTNNMIGLPTETPEEAEETLELNRKLRPNQVQMTVFYPFPGTELREYCAAHGYLRGGEQTGMFDPVSALDLPTFPPAQIAERADRFWTEMLRIKIEKERWGVFDLLAELERADVRSSRPGYVTACRANVAGEEWGAIFAHPESRIRYLLDLPKHAHLTFAVALSPQVWSPDKGTGVDFEIVLEKNGTEQVIYSRYVDPKQHTEDRRWHFANLDLTAHGPGPACVHLITTTRGRPDHYCWATWLHPVLHAGAPGPEAFHGYDVEL